MKDIVYTNRNYPWRREMTKQPFITKSIIPVAGLGTRSLPASKTIPKEMLPVHDKPTVQYIVEEAVNSGLEHIVFITNRDKKSIEDHFDYNLQLEALLAEKNKPELLKAVRDVAEYISIVSIRQKQQKGLGHAILCAKDFIHDEYFAVMLGDDLFFSPVPGIKQLMDVALQTGKAVIGVMEVEENNVSKYGIIDPIVVENTDGMIYKVRNIVEKPKQHEAPSRLAVVGRYVLSDKIFDYLETISPSVDGEIQLTDAIQRMAQNEGVLAVKIQGERFDAGDRIEYLLANIHFALQDERLAEQLTTRLLSMLQK